MLLEHTSKAIAEKPRSRPDQWSENTWKIGSQRIVQGDCLTILKEMAAESIDLVITSPPYNIGVAYKTYQDRKPRDAYLKWLTEIGKQLCRVMRADASFFLNVGSTNSDPWLPQDVSGALRDIFYLQNHIVWVKSISIGDDTVGHFKPITSQRYLNHNHEAIFHYTKSGNVPVDRVAVGVPFKDKSNIARWGHKADKRCAGNVWFLPYKTVKSRAQKFDHPAGFPVSLPERCIRLHGKIDACVLDPFLGAGTTLVATQRLGCQGIGIEIDPHYVESSLKRLKREIEDG
jgi:site-specific DNA-methyltransferase (adenine-specific)